MRFGTSQERISQAPKVSGCFKGCVRASDRFVTTGVPSFMLLCMCEKSIFHHELFLQPVHPCLSGGPAAAAAPMELVLDIDCPSTGESFQLALCRFGTSRASQTMALFFFNCLSRLLQRIRARSTVGQVPEAALTHPFKHSKHIIPPHTFGV